MKTKKKILIVEDDIDILSVLETILSNEGYELKSASTMQEGYQLACQEKFDLALLDIILEGPTSGLELAQRLKSEVKFSGLRIVLQTSLRIFEADSDEILRMARYYRQDPEKSEMDIIVVEDYKTGKVGFDYRDQDGNYHLLEVDGLIRKPLTAYNLINKIDLALQGEKKHHQNLYSS